MSLSVPKPEWCVVQGQLSKPQTPENSLHPLAGAAEPARIDVGLLVLLPTCPWDFTAALPALVQL